MIWKAIAMYVDLAIILEWYAIMVLLVIVLVVT